jgi:DNA-binding CsgD family transcriptional regulator/tetratricopeptide (TPR) repeat protein
MAHLPGTLRHAPAFAFVGRARELALLEGLLPRTPGEGGHVALVAGEAGAGKTRLTRELAAMLNADGALVLSGGCDAAVRVPYRPFLETLDQLIRRGAADRIEGLSARELTRLLPNLEMSAGEERQPESNDPDTARHRLHVAVADVLAAAAQPSGLLLVLEDLHWADVPTLLLLRHLAGAAVEARMLVLVTYRDVGEAAGSALTETLIELRRHEGGARLRLAGLSAEEVREFARVNSGVDPEPELARVIAELSDGNAFLVTELWRELVETGSLTERDGMLRLTQPAESLETPDSVRAVVSHRLDRLAPATTVALETAAVAGPQFELATIREATDLQERDLLDAIDEAERHAVITDVPSRGLAYRFSHELVRLAVIDRLTTLRRAEIHLRVAEALASEEPGSERPGQLAALAHHFAAGAPVGGTERAVDYNLRAAHAATAALAFDESAERLRTALSFGIDDPVRAADAYLALGYASHRAGKALDALAAFDEAARLARSLDDHELLARAAIGTEEACWRPAMHDAASVRLLQEAALALGPDDSELRTRLLAGLARAWYLHGNTDDAQAAADASIATARRRGDRRGLAQTLVGAWSHAGRPLAQINAMLTEALQISEELDDPDLRTEALGWLVPSYTALLDHDQARRCLTLLAGAARRQNQPFHLHVSEHYRSALALCDGDLAEAEAAAKRSYEWSRLLAGRDASGAYGIQMFNVRREQGRLAELAPVVRLLADRPSGAWRPGLTALLAEIGEATEARAALDRTVDEELKGARHLHWPAALTYMTDAVARFDDVAAAERIYPELLPRQGSNAMIGHLVACFGATDRFLGMLAAVLGEWDLAERHFEAAAALNRQLDANTWLAHTLCEHGRMLIRRGRESDTDQARHLVSEALTLAERHGLTRVQSRARELRVATTSTVLAVDGLSARETDVLRLVTRGLSNREIGRELFISEHTTASHIRSILRKTDCANRTEAAAYAHRHGLVD